LTSVADAQPAHASAPPIATVTSKRWRERTT
jgi:hypothetical protein